MEISSSTATFLLELSNEEFVVKTTEVMWREDFPNETRYHLSANETSRSSLARTIGVALILGTISIVITAGNVLVLLAVAINRHLRSTTHYFIANLAVADLLVGTTVLPFSASLEVLDYWAFGQLFCDIWAALDVLCCTASIISLCVISIDRYVGVTRPLQHSIIITEARAGYIIVVVWLLSLAISIAPLFGWKEPHSLDPTACEVTKQTGYVLFSVGGSFYIPLTIILVVYFRVYREALSQSRFLLSGVKVSHPGNARSKDIALRIHTGQGRKVSQVTLGAATPGAVTLMADTVPPSVSVERQQPQYRIRNPSFRRTSLPSFIPFQSPQSTSPRQSLRGRFRESSVPSGKVTLAHKIAKFNREKKAAKTLGIVVGVFVVCWFPFFLVLPLEALCKTCVTPPLLFKIIFWLGYCNSLVNPVIYASSSREFKRAFGQILRCQFRRRPRKFLNDSSFFALRSVQTTSASITNDFAPNKTGQDPPVETPRQVTSTYRARVFDFPNTRTKRRNSETPETPTFSRHKGNAGLAEGKYRPVERQSHGHRRPHADYHYCYVEYRSPSLALRFREVHGSERSNTNRPQSVSTISDDGSVVQEISDEETHTKGNNIRPIVR